MGFLLIGQAKDLAKADKNGTLLGEAPKRGGGVNLMFFCAKNVLLIVSFFWATTVLSIRKESCKTNDDFP